MSHTEIVRTIKVDEHTIEVHIHLTEDEVRRLLLPHIVGAFADEMRRSVVRWYTINSDSTKAPSSPPQGGSVIAKPSRSNMEG